VSEATPQRLAQWIIESGLAGESELALLQHLCTRLVEAGVPITRAIVAVDTLHPVVESRSFAWRSSGDAKAGEYSRYDAANDPHKWLQSPWHQLIESGGTMLRRRLDANYNGGEFPILDDLRDEGITDYVALLSRFGKNARIGGMDGVVSSWATNRPEGFDNSHIATLGALMPTLALAIKSEAFANVAETLVDTYLGRDAGRRVLQGHITRGVADKINAVLWFSDLEGYTRISDAAPPEQVIPMLNEYADAIVSAIHGQNGDVLKFIGDGVLAVFSKGSAEETCHQALAANADARARVMEVNARRSADGLPVTRFYLGLHVGEVFYGNIGSVDRLDFTVVGPAVNETSRIATMCRSLDQLVLLSSAFAAAAPGCRDQLVSVGRYALRGVSKPQELYTLDPEAAQPTRR
jgi:adenylate cyclase